MTTGVASPVIRAIPAAVPRQSSSDRQTPCQSLPRARGLFWSDGYRGTDISGCFSPARTAGGRQDARLVHPVDGLRQRESFGRQSVDEALVREGGQREVRLGGFDGLGIPVGDDIVCCEERVAAGVPVEPQLPDQRSTRIGPDVEVVARGSLGVLLACGQRGL